MEAEVGEMLSQKVFDLIDDFIHKDFFNQKAFCARSSLGKNRWFGEMKKAQVKNKKSFPVVFIERSKIRLTLDILLHVPILVKHIKLHIDTGKEKNPLVLYNKCTLKVLKDEEHNKASTLLHDLRIQVVEALGPTAQYFIDSIQSYEELVEKADSINIIYKKVKDLTS